MAKLTVHVQAILLKPVSHKDAKALTLNLWAKVMISTKATVFAKLTAIFSQNSRNPKAIITIHSPIKSFKKILLSLRVFGKNQKD
jgi:hypothetical protein